jgi:hypothetical protein
MHANMLLKSLKYIYIYLYALKKKKKKKNDPIALKIKRVHQM